MKIKFDYTAYPTIDYDGQSTLMWRPLVDVTLFGSIDSRNVKALIDTGADDCLINIEFAEKLGVEFIGKRKFWAWGARSLLITRRWNY